MKTLKVLGSQLRKLSEALNDLMANRLPLLTAIYIADIKEALDKLLKPFNDEVNKIIRDFGDESGTVLETEVGPKKWAEFVEALKPLEEEELSLKITPLLQKDLDKGSKPLELLPSSILILREIGVVVKDVAPKKERVPKKRAARR